MVGALLRPLPRIAAGLLPQQAWAHVCAASTHAAATAAPSVFDRLVQLTVIDGSGHQRPVRGLVGQTLADALKETGLFEDNYFMPNPFEPAELDCHLIVSHQYLDKLPPLGEARRAEHERVKDDFVRLRARDNSIMGHYYKLSPELNGITVAMGEIEPWQTW